MKIKSIIVLAILLLLAGCGKSPASPVSSEVLPDSSAITEAATEPTQELVSQESVDTVTIPETGSLTQTEPEATAATEAEAYSQPTETEAAPAETKRPDAPAPTQPPAQSEPPKDTEPKATDPAPTQPAEPKPTNPPHTHSYKSKIVEPTCTERGYTEYRCSCGDSYKDSYTDALGHSFTEQNVEPTCTGGGYTLLTCSRCKTTVTTDATPALGHDYHDTVVEPTTSSQGYTEHTCSRCGDSYRDNYKDKLKEIYDLQAVIEYGCFYAQSLGFTIDRSMSLSNSGYYPGYYGGGYSLDFLKQRVAGLVKDTADMLTADGDTIQGYRCFIHASYDAEADKYYIVVLYG